jgi:SAM-dependent methyltransferase
MAGSDKTLGKVIAYYSGKDEQGRLGRGLGAVEYARGQEILRRHLPPPPAVVLDIGGAAGRYACWLAREGYTVHLVDPVPLHVEQARAASSAQPESPLASCRLGDARALEATDGGADAALLMGPLYHLPEAGDRLQALREAYRALRPGGRVFAACISRYASMIDGLERNLHLDPVFRQVMLDDLACGHHRNPTEDPRYFTEAYFHRPQQLADEVTAAGFAVQALLAVEGVSYVMRDLEQLWAQEAERRFLLELLARVEAAPELLGASPHLICVGEKAKGEAVV